MKTDDTDPPEVSGWCGCWHPCTLRNEHGHFDMSYKVAWIALTLTSALAGIALAVVGRSNYAEAGSKQPTLVHVAIGLASFFGALSISLPVRVLYKDEYFNVDAYDQPMTQPEAVVPPLVPDAVQLAGPPPPLLFEPKDGGRSVMASLKCLRIFRVTAILLLQAGALVGILVADLDPRIQAVGVIPGCMMGLALRRVLLPRLLRMRLRATRDKQPVADLLLTSGVPLCGNNGPLRWQTHTIHRLFDDFQPMCQITIKRSIWCLPCFSTEVLFGVYGHHKGRQRWITETEIEEREAWFKQQNDRARAIFNYCEGVTDGQERKLRDADARWHEEQRRDAEQMQLRRQESQREAERRRVERNNEVVNCLLDVCDEC